MVWFQLPQKIAWRTSNQSGKSRDVRVCVCVCVCVRVCVCVCRWQPCHSGKKADRVDTFSATLVLIIPVNADNPSNYQTMYAWFFFMHQWAGLLVRFKSTNNELYLIMYPVPQCIPEWKQLPGTFSFAIKPIWLWWADSDTSTETPCLSYSKTDYGKTDCCWTQLVLTEHTVINCPGHRITEYMNSQFSVLLLLVTVQNFSFHWH